jgi:DNA uptake protein ComE-like DNA-binding protein
MKTWYLAGLGRRLRRTSLRASAGAWCGAAFFAVASAAAAPAAPGAAPQPQPQRAASQAPRPAAAGLVDINSASREQLKTLPGVGDAEAARIIAGRPYLSKADLVTSKVLPAGVFVAIKRQIVARQDPGRTPRAPVRP